MRVLPILGLLFILPACAEAANTHYCGTSPDDWCVIPDDPCLKHKNATSCKADPGCYGMPYLGESLIACRYDARGFATNCPIIGCTSEPPKK